MASNKDGSDSRADRYGKEAKKLRQALRIQKKAAQEAATSWQRVNEDRTVYLPQAITGTKDFGSPGWSYSVFGDNLQRDLARLYYPSTIQRTLDIYESWGFEILKSDSHPAMGVKVRLPEGWNVAHDGRNTMRLIDPDGNMRMDYYVAHFNDVSAQAVSRVSPVWGYKNPREPKGPSIFRIMSYGDSVWEFPVDKFLQAEAKRTGKDIDMHNVRWNLKNSALDYAVERFFPDIRSGNYYAYYDQDQEKVEAHLEDLTTRAKAFMTKVARGLIGVDYSSAHKNAAVMEVVEREFAAAYPGMKPLRSTSSFDFHKDPLLEAVKSFGKFNVEAFGDYGVVSAMEHSRPPGTPETTLDYGESPLEKGLIFHAYQQPAEHMKEYDKKGLKVVFESGANGPLKVIRDEGDDRLNLIQDIAARWNKNDPRATLVRNGRHLIGMTNAPEVIDAILATQHAHGVKVVKLDYKNSPAVGLFGAFTKACSSRDIFLVQPKAGEGASFLVTSRNTVWRDALRGAASYVRAEAFSRLRMTGETRDRRLEPPPRNRGVS